MLVNLYDELQKAINDRHVNEIIYGENWINKDDFFKLAKKTNYENDLRNEKNPRLDPAKKIKVVGTNWWCELVFIGFESKWQIFEQPQTPPLSILPKTLLVSGLKS